MASKIIEFSTFLKRSKANAPAPRATPKDRVEQLPEWLQELDVEWIFKESDRRLSPNSGRQS